MSPRRIRAPQLRRLRRDRRLLPPFPRLWMNADLLGDQPGDQESMALGATFMEYLLTWFLRGYSYVCDPSRSLSLTYTGVP